ncbi:MULTISPECIES: cache domain-containing protein [unclassified Variovorax]|uniref:cache domain-containing protein n=1 Tax=unclassified Variovorax TaxID=663243 RepID=UPI00076BE104|nr:MULTISPECIES: cache domain-containing protein [unclassified Variovorax]KWT95558.1 PAS/PAC domain [Variovorax sp. WDL1]PNG50168.1 hypothetical protein CHC06_05791 [Variovorax sp. B2]PNG51041.1 hypothetical protein CHC07_05697 [Variovorax sp. B4]VTU42178.1 PAS domain S-box protein [Variovorax sp. SRS16]VTU42210.1 PAS domain S-box protein [Variovorax sp. PBL-E5]
MLARRIPLQYVLALSAFVVTSVTVAFAVWSACSSRERSIEEAYREGQLVAQSLSGHLSASLRDVTNTLHASASAIRAEGGYRALSPARVHQAIAREVLDNAVIATLLAVGPNGEVVASSGRVTPPDAYFKDCETLAYFKKTPLDRGTHIGEPRRAPDGTEWVLPISKAIYDDKGKFGGMVMALVDLRYVRTFYRSLTTRPHTVLSLVSDRGILLTRVPYTASTVGDNLAGTTLPVGSFGAEGTFTIPAGVAKDGRAKFAAYSRVPGHPLIVAVGLDRIQVFKAWREVTRGVILFCTVGLVFFWAMCAAIFAWLRRLRAEEERFELAASGLREGVFDYSTEPRRFYRSRQLANLAGHRGPTWGRTLEAFLGALAPEEKRRVLRRFLWATRNREGFRFDVSIERSLGGADVLFVSGQVVKDAAGQIVRVCGIVCDITELRRAETEAKRYARRYGVLFEQANDGIALFRDGKLMEANPKLLRMLRMSRADELAGFDPWDLAPRLQPDGQLSREMALSKMQSALSGLPVYFTWRVRRVDGSEFTVSISLTLVAVDGAPQLLAHVRDVRHMQIDERVTEPGALLSL